MIALNKRLGLISEITKQKPNLGKTAMMKFIYILQQVYKVPIGYDYEIYTYGPYSADVNGDIQLASDFDIIKVISVIFPTGYSGYELHSTDLTEDFVEREKDFVGLHRDSISEVVNIFGKKSVKDLELSSTIIYVYSFHAFNNWDTDIKEVSIRVKNIKPHFSIDEIESEYHNLDKLNLLQKSRLN